MNNSGEVFYPTNSVRVEKSILLFIGVKEIRNFHLSVWIEFIRETARAFPDYRIDVCDMKNHALLDVLTEQAWSSNIVFVRNTFSFTELQIFASEHTLVVGIDGGDINVMRSCTNSLTIFTFGNPDVWGPYTLGKSPETQNLSAHWNLDITPVLVDRFAARIFKRSFWLPAFQIQLSKNLVGDFPVKEIVRALRERLK